MIILTFFINGFSTCGKASLINNNRWRQQSNDNYVHQLRMASIDKNKTKSNGLLKALRITWRRRWRLTMEINRISLTSSDVRCSILHTDKANIRSRVECQEADAAAAGAIWEFSLSIRLNIFPINLSSGFVCHSVDSTASRHVKTRSLERESSNSSPRPFIHVHVSREFCFSSNIPLSDRLKFSGGEKI
jgi:hypothetical protein